MRCTMSKDSFVCVLENLPFGRIVVKLLFLLVGFTVGFEINRMPQVILLGEHMEIVLLPQI